MTYFSLFLLGLIFGSFFLVVGTRLPKNKSIIKPRSHCDSCLKTLKWYDLLPIISYIMNFGKCRYCRKPISILNPFVELITAFFFCFSYYLYGNSYEFLALIIMFSLAILIYITDFQNLIILDSPLVVSASLILLLKLYYFGFKSFLLAFFSGLILFIIMFLVKKFGDLLFKKESLGGGDIKLAFVIGNFLGVQLGLCALIFSSFLAFPYAFANLYLGQKKETPFGPFLISSTCIVFLFMEKFVNFLNYLF